MLESPPRIHSLHRQLKFLHTRQHRLQRLNERLSTLRLVSFLGGALATVIILLLLGFIAGGLMAGLTLAVFATTVTLHRRVQISLSRHRLWQEFKRTQIARYYVDWGNIPVAPPLTPRPHHPFETDLDLTGARSLHQLLDVTIAYESSERLADWLLNTQPNIALTQRRQKLVQELMPLAVFRQRLWLSAALPAGAPSPAPKVHRWHGNLVMDWLNAHRGEARPPFVLPLASFLSVLTLILGAFFFAELLAPLFLFSLAAQALLFVRYQPGELFGVALNLEGALRRLNAVLHHLEIYPYRPASALATLCAPLRTPHHRPSQQVRRLTRIIALASVQRNPLLWLPLNLLIPYDMFVASLLERSRHALTHDLPQWLDIWYELEALHALTNFAVLHPDYAFPQIDPTHFIFRAHHIGHPLLEPSIKVTNDFALNSPGDVVMITGSNMAGKSSFLRTVGMNLVLAYAGSVVNAKTLEIGVFRLFTCIKVSDSLADGLSYFYAEVKRLKALLQALENENPLPLCYLIDEIFRGTNNRERLIGSRAYVRALVSKNGFGLIATHDLELTHLADDFPQIQNRHFRETVSDGKMIFDYQLRAGPCPTTNALRIMAMEGLPIEDAAPPPML